MKTKGLLLNGVFLVASLHSVAFGQAQQEATPESKLIQFHMALLKRGPKWPADSATTPPVLQEHVAYVHSLLESGKAVIAGPIASDSDLVGVYIFRAKTAEEANSWVMADPAVASGLFVPEMHPWWSEDVMKKTSAPFKMTTAYLAFLVRGDKWTPEKTPATEAIQKAHLENINRLAEMKKLVVAGPFGDNGRLRGIFVFRVASIEEARELAETDPAVKAGRLALIVHPWRVPDGILP
ncbi:MAG TPA: YciI family protein [Pyrinomonadaceae bacterium]|nr:YciI family protein [Pyrinomonadaceae bacterium]